MSAGTASTAGAGLSVVVPSTCALCGHTTTPPCQTARNTALHNKLVERRGPAQLIEVRPLTGKATDRSPTETVTERTCGALSRRRRWSCMSRVPGSGNGASRPALPPRRDPGRRRPPRSFFSGQRSLLESRSDPKRARRRASGLAARAASVGLSLNDLLLDELNAIADRPPIADVLRRSEARPGGPQTEALVAAVRAARESA